MIYAKKLTSDQRKVLQDYENISGFEPLKQDEFDAGEISFAELWSRNIRWLEDVLANVTNLDTSNCFETEDT